MDTDAQLCYTSIPVSLPLGWCQPYSGESPTSINPALKLPHRPLYVSTAILNPIKSISKIDHHSYLSLPLATSLDPWVIILLHQTNILVCYPSTPRDLGSGPQLSP